MLEDIKRLQKIVAEANLPTDLMTLRDCFKLLLDAFAGKYEAEQSEHERRIINAALSGFIFYHLLTIQEKHPEIGTLTANTYSRIFAPDPAQAYFMSLNQFVEKHLGAGMKQDVFSTSDLYVEQIGQGETLEYRLGTRMAEETMSRAVSVDQLIRRMTTITYIDRLTFESKKHIIACMVGWGTTIVSTAFLERRALPAILAAAVIYYPKMTRQAEAVHQALERVEFESERLRWLGDILYLLESPDRMKLVTTTAPSHHAQPTVAPSNRRDL